MEKAKIEKAAFNYFSNGFHCAESMAKVLNENFGSEDDSNITKFASPFGGGMGGTHSEVCGALSGALIFLGANGGRIKAGENIDDVMDLSVQFRKKFIENYSCTNCQGLLDKFGPQENSMDCKLMVSKMAGIFAETITENQQCENWANYKESTTKK